MSERVQPVVITDHDTGKKYTLDFSRETVRRIEAQGFSYQDIDRYPTKAEDFFAYAFLKNHERDVKRKEITRIFEGIGGYLNAPVGMFERLVELYVQALDSTVDAKNSNMTVEF